MRRLKLAVFFIGRVCGLFALARVLTQDGLRILCYHGVSKGTTHLWRPMLFMQPRTFAKRLDRLIKCGYPVLSLDDAIRGLADGTLPPNATAITIDDGFQLTEEDFVPLLVERDLPATIYVTSYYALKNEPIFELVIQYILWLSEKTGQDVTSKFRSLLGQTQEKSRDDLLHDFASRSLPEKKIICETLAARIQNPLQEVWKHGEFSLMTRDQIRAASRTKGISIQLHTRRHRFPQDKQEAADEISDNRSDLADLVTEPLLHFCYPSGLYSPEQFRVLEEQQICSATTTDNGLNFGDANHFALLRYLDSEAQSMLEFEAELSGFAHLLRRAVGRGGQP